MKDMPLIRLEIENMKQSMLVALSDYHLKVSEEVDIQLQNVVKNYPFERIVSEAANEAITDAIDSYFKYGDGYKMIKKAIQVAFDEKWTGDNE